MRQRLYQRLQQLEEIRARDHRIAQSRDQDADAEETLDQFRLFLALRGFEQGTNESLAEASARALEISCDQLHEQLEGGIDPIHEYLANRA